MDFLINHCNSKERKDAYEEAFPAFLCLFENGVDQWLFELRRKTEWMFNE
ncbi:hypothetical protein B4119_2063 [Parageobacillus caldoxylosilyticus]|uniref:Uncharacterized protein n=2 Tax=Saccharococcus caldoxylosilyticus TaxID=81408 RepID=A0A150LBK0_9BACL|nr:hypothetical protein B4119_2063 [Parageobacillus caldoxylosilyticus]MBB3854230.1 hypothetical protein [Parageobacillus caldoxylosilyticus]QXJ40579.1 hypothetical protein BV455_03953 [Parageobacillus caldoxylosilyticus]GAJ41203.1 putative transposase [Parageobacillus caldoxylosilyticus NBRC 107762]